MDSIGCSTRIRSFSIICVVLVCVTMQGVTTQASPSNSTSGAYKVLSILEKPYLYQIEDDSLKGNGRYAGLVMDILDAMGLAYEIHVREDGKYGTKNKGTKEWDGIIGDLSKGDGDIAAGALVVTKAREEVVDFTNPFQTNVGPVVITYGGNGQSNGPGLLRLLSPFHVSVWLFILVAYIVVSILLFAILKLSPDEGRMQPGDPPYLQSSQSCWFGWSTLMLQGYDSSPRSLPGRMLVAFWWVFALVTVVTYGSSLVCLFLAPHSQSGADSDKAFDTVADLLGTDINYGIVAESPTMEFFRDTKDHQYQKMWRIMKSKPLLPSTELALRQVRKSQGTFALITESGMAEYQAGQLPCDLSVSEYRAAERQYAFAVKENNPLRDTINEGLEQLRTDGLLQQITKKWFRDRCADRHPAKGKASYSAFRLVTIADFFVPILLLCIGVLLTIGVLVYQIRPKQNNKGGLRGMENKALDV